MLKPANLLFIVLNLLVVTNTAFAVPYFDTQIAIQNQRASDEYNKIKLELDKCIYLLENKDPDALNKIQELDNRGDNFGGIFVIAPQTGKILVSPIVKSSEEMHAFHSEHINGKALAREAIQKWQKRRKQNLLKELAEIYTTKFMDFYTDVAITDEGKVYVVAIGKNDIKLQHLFVTKLVQKACTVLKETGPNEAYKIFNNEDSIYRYNSESYIYVYSDTGVCLYNPNYPELQGKDATKADTGTAKMIEMANLQSAGWLECQARIPGEEKESKKEIYFQSVFYNGKKYIVGSGIYVDED